MIGEIKAFCLMACALSLLSMMIQAVAPTRMKKQVEMAVNLFLLLCLLTPLARISPPDPAAVRAAAAVPVDRIETDAILKREIESRLATLLCEKLEKNGILPEAVRIDITVAENGVEINRATVELRTQDDQLRVRTQSLAEELLACEVSVDGGREGT